MNRVERAEQALSEAVTAVAQVARDVAEKRPVKIAGRSYIENDDDMAELRDMVEAWTNATNEFLAAVHAQESAP